MTSRVHRWLFVATRWAWFGQADDLRVRIAAERLVAARAAIEPIALDFAQASSESDPTRRTRLTLRAMADLLRVIGENEQVPPGSDSLSTGIERVVRTLPEGPLQVGIELVRKTPPPDVLSTTEFLILSELFSFCTALVDCRSARERRLEPWGRRAGLAFLFGAILVFFFFPRNIASGHVVTASSVCGLTPPAPYARPRLHRVIDGVTSEPAFAICTNKEVHPWIQVDLERARQVSKVVVHGRSECCWGQDDTPLSIQLSRDGKSFQTVAVRDELIMVDFPWRASFSSQAARYVRVTSESSEKKNIVISEIEVHAR